MSNKIQLGDVQETLLIPLYFRASESSAEQPLFRDEKAVQILPELSYDFSGFDSAWALRNDVVVRTVVFDELVADFIERNPTGVIINLGCGLDARFDRLDNGSIDWYDLDMPDSIELRNRFFDADERNHVIAKSMFDKDWFHEINDQSTTGRRPVLIVAEALFFYFEESMIRGLLGDLSHRFPGSELVFQSVSPGIVGRQSMVPLLRRTRAELKWGIHSAKDVATWNSGYELLGQVSLVDRYPERWRWYRLAMRIPPFGRYLREVMRVNHLRLGVASCAEN